MACCRAAPRAARVPLLLRLHSQLLGRRTQGESGALQLRAVALVVQARSPGVVNDVQLAGPESKSASDNGAP